MTSKMLRAYAVLASALSLALLWGCEIQNILSQEQSQSSSASVSGASGTAETGDSKCSPEEATPTKVNVLAPVQLSVGQTFLLDATPVKAGGTGRNGECDEEQGITWASSGPCGLSAKDVFRPTLTAGPGTGDCSLLAYVSKFPGAAGSATVQVVP